MMRRHDERKTRTSFALGSNGGLLDVALDGAERLGRARVEDELSLDERGQVGDGLGLEEGETRQVESGSERRGNGD